MADLPNEFWGGWITALTLISLAVLAWVVISIFFFSNNDKQGSHANTVWDGNLKEGSAAPPLWWFWLIFSAMIISLIYLILYPGLGSFKGVLNWSQDSRLQNSHLHYEISFAERRQNIVDSSLQSLAEDTSLMASAESIFSRNCATCHGYDGRGQANLFPNLKDSDWQWGGSEAQIEQTLLLGRKAQMPGLKAVLSEQEMKDIAGYVLGLTNQNELEHAGKVKFEQICAACHGADGKGNQSLGAPNLTDNIWLYGKTEQDILLTIREGRRGEMPAFQGRLDTTQIRLLVAWLSK